MPEAEAEAEAKDEADAQPQGAGWGALGVKREIDVAARNWRPSPLAGPICLVTTVDARGWANMAPKSLISFITVRPARIILGCNRGHHTAQNLLANGECVLNLPGDHLAARVWEAGDFMAPAPDEVEARGFTPIPSLRVRPPRLAECAAHIECRLEGVQWFDDECALVLAVVAASADAEVCDAPDPYAALRPIFFLAPGTYGTITGGAAVSRGRPAPRP